jgi:two-component system chemotaxis sensor kinase CheA
MKRILIIEDNKDMQSIYRYIFRGVGKKYAISIAGSPHAAMRRLTRGTFHLIISDIIMETVADESFIIALRRDKRYTRIPILVVSVLKRRMLDGVRDYGDIYFLEKPFDGDTLLKIVKGLLG